MQVVTRIAPSPTGLLHCGTLRTALYNFLFAKKHGGIFYLRIEDTDQKRFVPEAEDYIKKSFEWAGFEPDFSPWKPGDGHFAKLRQSERDYSAHIEYLVHNKLAYLAFDTEEELTKARKDNPHFAYDRTTRMKMRNSFSLAASEVKQLIANAHPYVIRFNTPDNQVVHFTDLVRGEVTFNSNQVDDKVLVKSNGIPTYHLASVCDDHDMQTTHVIRGDEWLPSTPLHIMLYQAFGWKAPEFAHLPTILRPDGKGKFSKRDALKYDVPIFPFGGTAQDDKGNMVTYKGFKDEGFEADAMLNFLLLLGWAPDDDREIFSLKEMIDNFSLDRVHKAGARYDIEKAKWFNSQYLHKRSFEDLVQCLDVDGQRYEKPKMESIVEMAKLRSTFRHDMQKVADIFFKHTRLESKVKNAQLSTIMKQFLSCGDCNWDSSEELKEKFSSICLSSQVKAGKLMPNLRSILTGGLPGPELFTTMSILGKVETTARVIDNLTN